MRKRESQEYWRLILIDYPDFLKSKIFLRIAGKMRISDIVEFSLGGQASDYWTPDLIRRLETVGIDVILSDLDVDSDTGLYKYKGKPVLVYIRDQYKDIYEGGGYKVHVLSCEHLKEVERQGRINRYVVTYRTDGYFDVNVITHWKVIATNIEEQLRVCKKCLRTLNYKNFGRMSYDDREDLVQNFSFGDFFNHYYGANKFRKLPKHSSIDSPLHVYPPNWSDIARAAKMAAGQICADCGRGPLRLTNLQVHHIDGNKGNCEQSNLKVVCRTCHQKYH